MSKNILCSQFLWVRRTMNRENVGDSSRVARLNVQTLVICFVLHPQCSSHNKPRVSVCFFCWCEQTHRETCYKMYTPEENKVCLPRFVCFRVEGQQLLKLVCRRSVPRWPRYSPRRTSFPTASSWLSFPRLHVRTLRVHSIFRRHSASRWIDGNKSGNRNGTRRDANKKLWEIGSLFTQSIFSKGPIHHFYFCLEFYARMNSTRRACILAFADAARLSQHPGYGLKENKSSAMREEKK